MILEYSDLKIALLSLSLIAFSALAAGWQLKSCSQNLKKDITPDEENAKSNSLIKQLNEDFKILKLFPFWAVSSIYIIFIYVFLIFLIILPDLAVNRGLDKQSAALLVSIYSIGDFAGRLIPGYLHFKNVIHNQTFYSHSIIVMASLFILIEFYAISFLTFSILCFLIGFVSGCQMSLPVVVMVEFIGNNL